MDFIESVRAGPPASKSAEATNVSRWGDDPREQQSAAPHYREYPKISERDQQGRTTPQDAEGRQTYRERDREYQLNQAEIAVIRDVGRFRIVDAQDLTKFVYRNQQNAAQRDLRHLENQKLIRFVRLPGKERTKYATLTKQGKELVSRRFNQTSGQEIYAGVKKLREADHDAAVYRVYQTEVAKMRARGCEPQRIHLDYELKRDVQKELARERQKNGKDMAIAREEIAQKYHLKVVENKIQFPDVRVEYEGPEQGLSIGQGSGEVDLEYVSEHYKPGQIAAKRAAGFTLYTESGRSGRSAHGPDLIMDILR
jgi:DNA-binding MarR family transcriptional regulator